MAWEVGSGWWSAGSFRVLSLPSRYRDSGERVEGEPMDAGSCVMVQEAQRGKVSLPLSFSIVRGDWAEVVKTLLGKPTEKLWGRVEDPAAWLLLAKDSGAEGADHVRDVFKKSFTILRARFGR